MSVLDDLIEFFCAIFENQAKGIVSIKIPKALPAWVVEACSK